LIDLIFDEQQYILFLIKHIFYFRRTPLKNVNLSSSNHKYNNLKCYHIKNICTPQALS
jgi:hypothetical protein